MEDTNPLDPGSKKWPAAISVWATKIPLSLRSLPFKPQKEQYQVWGASNIHGQNGSGKI